MLNKEMILNIIEPYLNSRREITEDKFFELFQELELKEYYEITQVMCEHNIDFSYADEESEIYYDDNNDKPTLGGLELVEEGDYKEILHLTNEQLCVMAQSGDRTALAALVEKNKRFVCELAIKMHNQYRNADLTIEDMCQEGIIGLMEAVKKFDVSKEFKFLTYAWSWIRQKISRSIIDTGYKIRLPVHMFEKIIRVNNCRGKYPDVDIKQLLDKYNCEYAKDEPVKMDEFKEYLLYAEMYLNTSSLNVLVGEGSDTELEQFIVDDTNLTVEELVMESLVRDDIAEMIGTLTPKEQDVIKLRFGFEGKGSRTLDEVGRIYGVTRERIRQIEAKAIKKLSVKKLLKEYYEEM